MRVSLIIIKTAFVVLIAFFSVQRNYGQEIYYSKSFADAIIDRHSNINLLTGKGWEYSNSIVLIGIEKLYYETGNVKYLNYIKRYIDNYIDDNGSISFDTEANNLDHLHPGWLCITLYEELGEEKYKLAAGNIRKEFNNQPRNPSGGFWHKQKYPNQMWADGIYMAEPFLIRYGNVFNDLEYASDESTEQAILLAEHTYDSTKNLILHGWDETKEALWADTITGQSPEVWSRGMGWYCMALVDILDYLPSGHKNYNRLIEILNGLAVGIKQYQDQETGLWHQVVDKGDSANNWHETSGSAMFVYSLRKAVKKGYIDSLTYMPVIYKGWEGLKSMITFDNKQQPVINGFVRGMGIKNSYGDYIGEEIVSTPDSRYPHGYCGILLASAEMEFPLPRSFKITTDKIGGGVVVLTPKQDEYLEGTQIEVYANSYLGWEFIRWEGDIESTMNPLQIEIEENIALTAVFEKETSGITTIKDVKELDIFPVVADKEIFLRVPYYIQNAKCKLVNSVGEQFSCSLNKINTGQFQFEVTHLSAGVYYLILKSDNQVFSGRFVKN